MSRVVIIEPDPSLIDEIEGFLDNSTGDIEFEEIHSFQEWNDKSPSVSEADVILIDEKLPDGDGTEMCISVTEEPKFYNTPILVMSSDICGYKGVEIIRGVHVVSKRDLSGIRDRVAELI